MPNKIVQRSHIKRLTVNGDYQYPGLDSEVGEVVFTSSYATGYYKGKTFLKIKGGGPKGGNYRCTEDSDEYRISKF